MSQLLYSNAVDVVATRLRSDILTGRLAPGTRLRQDVIASACGVSHIPVREALRRLEAEGLVSIRPRHGAAVATLSADEIQELYEIRVALECCAIRAVVRNASTQELDAAEAILDEIDREPDRWAELNTTFHVALYAAAHRPRLLATIEPIIRSCERYLHHEVQVLDNFEVSQREHRDLIRAIRLRDAKTACVILTKHI
ncbi:MAG: GntR family transcriptional regulator, partial [Candidatus Aquilonibacter sp.]